MEAMVANGDFVEWAHVHGNLYGTSRRSVQDVSMKNKVCILDIDVQGARSVAANAPELNALLLFVLPPTPAELEKRLRGRGTETEAAIQQRLANSAGEVWGGVGERKRERVRERKGREKGGFQAAYLHTCRD
jgi:guanylate kinase